MVIKLRLEKLLVDGVNRSYFLFPYLERFRVLGPSVLQHLLNMFQFVYVCIILFYSAY
jgi:hypothetical protein